MGQVFIGLRGENGKPDMMYCHADFADDADLYYDTFFMSRRKEAIKKICVICEISVTLRIICGFSPSTT